MRRPGIALPLVLWLVLIAAPAAAELREFAGRVTSVSGAAITVENRMGDRRSFERTGKSRVTGARSAWDEIRSDDSVIVSWSIDDQPAKARKVHVRAR